MAMRVAVATMDCEDAPVTGFSNVHRAAIIRRYVNWYHGPRPGRPATLPSAVNEPDSAYDTGVVFDDVFHSACGSQKFAEQFPQMEDDALCKLFDECAQAAYAMRQSAGVSPAHRNSVFAVLPSISSPEGLRAACAAETTITHLHPEAIQTSIATALICRELVIGNSLGAAVQVAKLHVTEELTLKVLNEFPGAPPTDRGGRSPLVLGAALYFVANSTSFNDAITQSIAFAGPANYCPVLVGSIGGALYGSGIDVLPGIAGNEVGVLKEHLAHRECKGQHLVDIADVARRIGMLWPDEVEFSKR